MNTSINNNGLVKVLNHHEQQINLHLESIFRTGAEFKEYTPAIHILEHIAILSYHKLGALYELKSHQCDAKHNLHYSGICYQRVKEFCCKFLKNYEENSLFIKKNEDGD
jgi:hypothetical protein